MIISTVIETLLKYWPVFPAVFVAGIVDAIAGGGGLITLPVYMLVGLPPHEAIGTNKMSSCMGTTTATYRFAREGYINFRLAVSPGGLRSSVRTGGLLYGRPHQPAHQQ